MMLMLRYVDSLSHSLRQRDSTSLMVGFLSPFGLVALYAVPVLLSMQPSKSTRISWMYLRGFPLLADFFDFSKV